MKIKNILVFLFVILNLFLEAQQTKITILREHGLSSDWDLSGSNRIAYASKGADKYYDIHICLPDGSGDTCITCNHWQLPNRHTSCPYFHPSGKWISFVAEQKEHPGHSFEAWPGIGSYSDIWIMNLENGEAFKMYEIPQTPDHGIILGSFSNDGKHILWTERIKNAKILSPKQKFGFWVIKTAEFSIVNGKPTFSAIRTFQPAEKAFYEASKFSPDNKRIVFCSNMNKPSVWDAGIFSMDTSGTDVKKLTEKDYNEHAFYAPDGRIVWMSNAENKNKGTDWWIMNPDGTDKKRLTFLNQRKHPQYTGETVWTGLGTFSPDGKRFTGSYQTSLISQEGKIVIVDMP